MPPVSSDHGGVLKALNNSKLRFFLLEKEVLGFVSVIEEMKKENEKLQKQSEEMKKAHEKLKQKSEKRIFTLTEECSALKKENKLFMKNMKEMEKDHRLSLENSEHKIKSLEEDLAKYKYESLLNKSFVEVINRMERDHEDYRKGSEEKIASLIKELDIYKKSSSDFNSLDNNCLYKILEYTGQKSYFSFGTLNKACYQIFETHNIPKETCELGYRSFQIVQQKIEGAGSYTTEKLVESVLLYNRMDLLHWSLENLNEDIYYNVCVLSIHENRLDILREVFQYPSSREDRLLLLTSDSSLCDLAAQVGTLECFKWLVSEGGCPYSEETCKFLMARGRVENEYYDNVRMTRDAKQCLYYNGTFDESYNSGVDEEEDEEKSENGSNDDSLASYDYCDDSVESWPA